MVKRSVYEHLGAFYGVVYGEDWEMWSRIARHYPVAYHPRILAEYRQHDESISGAFYLTGKNVQDITKVIDTINSYLPGKKKKHLKYIARKNYAYFAFARKSQLWKKNHEQHLGLKYSAAILKMHTDPVLVAKVIKLSVLISLHKLTRKLFGSNKKQT